MGAGEDQPEALGAFREAAQVAAAVEQVVDELAPRGLFLPYRESLRALVPLGEGVDGLGDGGQHAVGDAGAGRAAGPGGAGGVQVQPHQSAQAVPRLRGPFPEEPPFLQLVAGQPASGPGDLGEYRGVPVQVGLLRLRLLLGLLVRHPVPPPAGHARCAVSAT
ncbi:hypothetical protein ACVILE_003170 [Streptomyces sp. M18.1]